MKKTKVINLFEEFSKSDRDEMSNDDVIYLKKHIKEKPIVPEDIKEKIIKYDIYKFTIDIRSYGCIIYPDKEFIEILSELNNHIDNKISLNINFPFSIYDEKANQIDLDFQLPVELMGLKLGYKLYKFIINNFDYITSNKYSSIYAKNIWFNLMCDNDYHCFTSLLYSGVILKNVNDIKLKKILDNIKIYISSIYDMNDIIFDDILKEKINTIYGDIELYKK